MIEIDQFVTVADPRTILTRIGEGVRLARQRGELTQGELAQKAGVPATTISRMERTGLGSTDSLLSVLFALNELDALDAFVKERLRILKFPKTLAGLGKDGVGKPLKRVCHKRSKA